MDKIRLPHSCLSKREVSPSEENFACSSPNSTLVDKHLLSTLTTCPVYQKAFHIPFPVETCRLAQAEVSSTEVTLHSAIFTQDIAILSPLLPASEDIVHNIPFINSSSIHKSSNHLQHRTISMHYCSDDDNRFRGVSSPKSKSGSVSIGAAFDVKELERKLNAVGEADRRKYYASPMLTRALPTPIHEEAYDMTREGDQGFYYKQGMSRGTEVRRSPMRVLADASPLFERGNALDESSNESNSLRQSTSSSDTGIDRRSSSLWERDVFSVNSERSATLATRKDGDRPNHINMQRSPAQLQHGKPKDRTASAQSSPLLYPIGQVGLSKSTHSAESTSRMYEDHAYNDFIHAQKGRSRINGGITRKDGTLNDVNSHGHNNSSIHVGNHVADAEDVEWGGFTSSVYRSPPEASPTSSRSSSWRGRYATELMDKYHPMGLHPSFPNHEPNIYELPLVETRSSKRAHSGSDQFSYMGCKERLLSGRSSFEQGNDTAGSEGEVERLSNYDKFKLRQLTSSSYGKLNRAWSLSPDIGPYKYMQANKNPSLIGHASYHSTPEHHSIRGPSQRSLVFDPSKASPRRKGPNVGLLNNLSSQAYVEKGPSWSNKATLKAVREKTRDPSFQSFSKNAQPGEAAHSRVFDSIALVKCSYDPKQDFKESMVEMIFEKDLNSSHDMVELLQCYLTLNPPRYHDTIVKVFTEVWSEVFQDG